MLNSVDVRSAFISHIKSKTAITSLLSSADDIKEAQWQGTDFNYPAVRVSMDFLPSVDGCSPDNADFVIETFSEEKSSKQADTISDTIVSTYHRHPFIQDSIKFNPVIVARKDKAYSSIYGWLSRVELRTQVV